MKRFVIISAVLLLLGGAAFGYSLSRYLTLNQPEIEATEATQETSTESATDPAGIEQSALSTLDDDGIFSEYYDKAADYVAKMSTEQMVGQMLLGVCTDTSTAASDINRYSLSGFLFDSTSFDYMSEDEVKASLDSVRTGANIAPVLAAQEEGGNVNTVSDHEAFAEVTFSSPRDLYDTGGLAAVESAEDEKATFLKDLGFNLNLAPVVDLPESFDQIMYSRSLTSDAQAVATYAEYCAKFDQAKGVSVCLKHFPGYGTIPDTLDSVVTDTRDAATIRATDYTPFKTGAAAGAHFIMVSNVVVENIDASHTAALSPTLHNELRNVVGFSGIILTDLIDRADYSAYADGNDVAVAAVLAGNDMILVSDYAAAYQAILSAVNDGTVDGAILQQTCTRIIAYKYAAGILK